MLTRVNGPVDDTGAAVAVKDASFPAPFASGLEYAAPARGTWNIVHVGMLIPQAHQIFVCAQGCLRGVVLTAAEMGAQERFSTVAIEEHNVLEGDLEELLVDGVTDILHRLPRRPPAVLVYTSCIHHFLACDLPLVYQRLSERFPEVDFVDCYMNPIMRKSGLTPDQLMRRQLYAALKPRPREERTVGILGNCFPLEESSELMRMLRGGGWTVRDIHYCRSYAEYQRLAGCGTFLTTFPAARAGGEALAQRLGREHLYLPGCWGYDEIGRNLDTLAGALELPREEDGEAIERAEEALAAAHRIIGQCPVVIDYTATARPLGLARLLLEHGFQVQTVYADSFSGEEKEDFLWLQAHAPELTLRPTVQVKMRLLPRQRPEKTLAIGQKAAYFTSSRFFVNLVEGGGLYGYDGVRRMAQLMLDAYLHERDTRTLIQVKGLGCGCCV